MTHERVGWIDATAGIAGDMLLAACVHAGGSIDQIQQTLDSLGLAERVELAITKVQRGTIEATHAHIRAAQSDRPHRLADVLKLVERLDDPIASRSASVFRALASAEAHVHGVKVDDVHFHEGGALDSIADVVGVVTGLTSIGVEHLICSPIALGGGRMAGQHGSIPVPGPVVLELLRATAASAFGGPVELELATPTGVAIAVALAEEHSPLPTMKIEGIGVGAGSADPEGHTNVVRLVVGTRTAKKPSQNNDVVLETNIDDLDPRLWPAVLMELLKAGASDAWLTPIIMKKGRPAHMLSVLATPDRVDMLQGVVFAHTTTMGLRRRFVEKIAIPREEISVEVEGLPVRVKIAYMNGHSVTATPEYEDVANVAERVGQPAKEVMEAARAAAVKLVRTH